MAPLGNDTSYQTATTEDRPLLFGILHRMEAVENIGSGIRRIRRLCREHGVAEPVFEVSEHWVTTVFPRPTEQAGTKSGPSREQVPGEVTGEVTGEVASEVGQVVQVLITGQKTRAELQNSLGLRGQANFRDRYLQPALEGCWIEMTIPDKPKSRSQKYRLTAKGKALASELTGKADGSSQKGSGGGRGIDSAGEDA